MVVMRAGIFTAGSANVKPIVLLLATTIFTVVISDIIHSQGTVYGLNSGTNSSGNTIGSHIMKVTVGGGNASSGSEFSPEQLNVRVGDNVTWYNAAKVPEPHTVTFVRDQNFSVNESVSPFNVPKTTQFIPIPPNSNSEPVLAELNNDSNIVLAANTRAINPIVIDTLGDITYLSPNASYVFNGTEKYLNSGTIFPEGKTRPPYPAITDFTISFGKVGTYSYHCIFHPWMKGTVIVK